MAEIWRRKVACFQKMCNNVVKKSDMAAVTNTKVNADLSPGDLVHMVDVSVASKYGADLTQFTWVIMEDMRSTFDALKQDLNSSLSRQVRALVQQINGESQAKRVEETHMNPNLNQPSSQGNSGMLANVNQPSSGFNLNLQQPFYQTKAYGPNMTPMGSGMPHRPVPNMLFPRTPATNAYHVNTDRMGNGAMAEGVREQITRTLREFGFAPKGHARAYQKPNPEYFDTIPYPRGFRVPDFAMFNGAAAKTTYKHVGQNLAQVNDVVVTDVHKIRLLPLSLFFNWFTSLAPNSVDNW
jgi:hypothetical protein